jgi:toxin FitB
MAGILIDTNVMSELWRAQPAAAVLAWVDAQVVETLSISAITVAELRFGIAAMPEGRRRTVYENRLEQDVLPAFANRVLAFDLRAAAAFAKLMAPARRNGASISQADGYIAATAAAAGLAVATRDVAPFQAVGLDVINPWQD